MQRIAPGEELPSLHDDIDVTRIKLETVADRPVISAAITLVPEPRNGS
jgi:hypothetical protein